MLQNLNNLKLNIYLTNADNYDIILIGGVFMGRRLTIEEIREKIENSNISVNYTFVKNGNTFCNCSCLNGHGEWDASWVHLSRGTGCLKCSINKRIKPNYNSIRDVYPDLIIYLKNKSDADKYSHGSHKKLDCVCPYCKTEKIISVYSLTKQGFSCPICSDNISIPEKFGIGLFKQLGINFGVQKSFEWSNKKKYDFYLMELNTIIETHGEQHYKESNRGKGLIEEQKNDRIKKQLALQNGIKHYVEIDCRKSEFEWLKENYIKELSKYFNLSEIDWLKIWEYCQSSLKVKVWEAWNNRDENETTVTIGNEFGLNKTTIVKYLKTGNILQLCTYDSKYEMIKNGKRHSKKVYQYNKDSEFICEWESAKEVERKIKIASSSITACCNGNLKTAGGYIWSYNPPENKNPV